MPLPVLRATALSIWLAHMMALLSLVAPRARYSVRSLKARLAIGADLLRFQASLGCRIQTRSTWLAEYLKTHHGEPRRIEFESMRKRCIRDMRLYFGPPELRH